MSEPFLDDVLAQSAIAAQLSRAARLLDGKRWTELGTVFREDVVFDYGDRNGARQGLALLRDTFSRHLDRCGQTQHLLGSILVEVHDDWAESRVYVQAGTPGSARSPRRSSTPTGSTWTPGPGRRALGW